jgi:hypothetical protein
MKFAFAAILVVALSASQAVAQAIPLHPGETVTIRIDNGQAVVARTTQAAPMSKFEAYALWRAETTDVPPGVKVMPPGFIIQGEGPPNPPRPDGDLVQLTMRRVPGLKPGSPDNTALFISNGYGSTLRYRAVMRANGRSVSTDVCDVAPNRPGLEHWPYVIDQLDLSALQLLPENGQIQCG